MRAWSSNRGHRIGLAVMPGGLALLIAGLIVASARADSGPKVNYNRDIRPILSDNCFACHGPDASKRKAGLRLDTPEGALAELESGSRAIVPGNPDESELIARITAEEDSIRMPPPKARKTLKPEQIDLLRRWIEQGAPMETHWAFLAPQRPALPEVSDPTWPRTPIDRFLLARLDAEGLKPSPEADKRTLIRRVTLDLTGLPPTLAEVEAFLADNAPDAYEHLVERLLRSPRYGEHMARFWLDAARYGDTHGLHLDNYREIWPYREWVIQAFNRNLPYDQFLIEQLAGDMLPDATLDQKIASGFNRCHVTTSEGGSIAEEVYVRNVLDRVETTGTVFLGLTIGCARCHDHKYDPVKMKDFYGLFAFFNSLDDDPLDRNAKAHPPVVQVPTEEQKKALEQLDQKIAALKKTIAETVAQATYDESADAEQGEYVRREDFVYIDDALPPGAVTKPDTGFTLVEGPDHPVLSGTKAIRRTADQLGQSYFVNAGRKLRVGEGDTLFAYVFLDPTNPPKEVMLQWRVGDWKHRAYWGENLIDSGKDGTGERLRVGPLPTTGEWVRLEVPAARLGLKPGTLIDGWAFAQHGGTVYWDKAGLRTFTPQEGQTFDSLTAWVRAQRASGGALLPKPIQQIIQLDRSKRTSEQKKQLLDYFIENAYAKTRPLFEPLHQKLAEVEKQRAALDKEIPTTLVSFERKEPRPAYILKRGEYDQKGEKVERQTPAFLPPMPEGAPRDRLGFAQWLVAPNHPLTARVAVNRFWQQFFGTGIVKTAEDFGLQGEPPSHPELLDWLAVDFREHGWDIKRLVRQIVLSAAYRQSSKVTPDRLAKDPNNRLVSRGPRFRLDAEMLRDQALAVSGLLAERLGGPSIKPWQPPGLWEAVGYTSSNTAKFVPDTGHEKVHRRSLYIFWKRTAPPPQMTTFDAPSREACFVRRERTNTPLQALVLMNEPQYVEAARALAERTLREGGATPRQRLAYMFQLVTCRPPDDRELDELVAAYGDHLSSYTRDPQSAQQLISVGETKPDPAFPPSELAAWTMIGNLLLNLDEVITKG